MATKQVSVRLSATGGRQVRAELEGVGEAGSRGFGRLSREMEAANARLASFARRAKIAATAAATALAGAALSMTRSTVTAANEISQLAQAANATPEVFQRWSAASSTVGIEQEKLADILKDVNDRVGDFLQTGGGPMADFFENIAPRVGVTAEQFARLSGPEALQLYVDCLERAGVSQQEMTFYLEAMASDATRLIPLLQNGGAEMGRLGEQAQRLGAVLDADAIAAMRRSELALVSMGQVFTGIRNKVAVALAPSLEAMANAFVALASSTSPLSRAFDTVLANLDRLAIYAGTFATFLASRWVAAMAAAAISLRGLATGLVFLRGALIRTGIGALIVGAGELVYWFTRLASGAGGFGEAMGLLKDVASQVWTRVALSAQASWTRVESSWAAAQAVILDGFQSATDAVTGWANATVNTFEGTFLAVQAIWNALPEVFDRIGALAINGLVSAMETGLGGITEAVNAVLTLGGRRPEWAIPAPDLSEWMATVPEAVQLGERAAEAYGRAFEDNPFQAPQLFGGMADEARGRSAGYSEAARMLSDAAARPITAWQALRDAMSGSAEDGAAAIDDAATSADRLGAALTEAEESFSGEDFAAEAARAGSAAQSAADQIRDAGAVAASGWAAVSDTLASYARDAMDWGKGLGETLVGAFRGAENAFRDFVRTGKLDFKGLVASILEDLAVLHFRNAVLGPIANALSSAFGGWGGSSVTAAVSHAGGIVGISGYSRQVPALAFAGAPRMHAGGWAGLRPDEVPTILQRGERVLNRREAAQYGGDSGATSRVRIELGEGLVGHILEQAGSQSVEIAQSSLRDYDRLVAPRTLARVSQDPRRRG
jgi:hypothetical protein